MADAPTPQLIVPDNIREKYSEHVKLIVGSESMNIEEKQYWINILPIMTPEQLENLHGILTNEREQLKAIDAKYASQVKKVGNAELVKKTGEQRKERRQSRETIEKSAEEKEEVEIEQVLKDIENM